MLSGSAFVRYTIGFLLAGTLALLAIVIAASWLSSKTGDDAEEVVRLRVLRTKASTVLISLLDLETAQRGYIITGTPEYLGPYQDSRPKLLDDIEELRKLIEADRGDDKVALRLTSIARRKLSEMDRTIELIRGDLRDEAIAVVNTDAGRRLMDEARGIVGEIVGDAEKRVAARLDSLGDAVDLLRIVTLFGSVLIILFAGGAAYTVLRHTRNLQIAQLEIAGLNAGLEERVQERTAALTRANDEIQRFAYIVSHDLRSPLVNVMGFTSELEATLEPLRKHVDAENPDEATRKGAKQAIDVDIPESVGFIRTSTAKMDRLINAILKLSREGRRELNPEPVDVGKLLGQAAASVQHQLDEVGASVELPLKSPVIVTDRLALEQVVGNLLDNAVKYLSPGRIGKIRLAAVQRGSRVQIDIIDNGRGIAAQDHERVFELFRRAGTQDKPGEGIGLAHVRALVRRLGGDITVSSELGRGSTFQIDLPARFRPIDR